MSRGNFWIREDGKKYDDNKRRNAAQRAGIYYLVAIYVGYMGYSILYNRLIGDDTMTYPLAIILASLLIAGAIFVAWYATRRMKSELEASEIVPEDEKEDQK
jgi:predicted branched-subunit amino acid permease